MKINILKIIIYTILILIAVKLIAYHYSLIAYPYQLEFREGASLQTTNTLLKGENPFALENQPLNTNVYGILYSIICYPFAKFFGATLFVHRSVSALFIFLSCFIFFLFAKKRKVNNIIIISTVLIFYASLLYFVTPLTRPDSLGLFLFITAFYITFKNNYSYKSLALATIIGILVFFTKTFFLLIFPYLFLYTFIFISKKRGIYFALLSFISLIIIVLISDKISKTYIANTFFNHMANFQYRVEYARSQIFFFIKSYSFIFLLSIISLSIFLIKNSFKIKQFLFNIFFTKYIINKLNFLKINNPVYADKPDFALFFLILSVIIFYKKIGGHDGAWITYLYQIVSPFLLLVLLDFLRLKYISLIPFVVAALLNLFLLYKYVLPKYDFNSYSKRWVEISNCIKPNNNILNSPGVLSIMLANHKIIYDSGQTEYFQYSHSSGLFSNINYFKETDEINSKIFKNSIKTITQNITENKFDIIILPTFYTRNLHDSVISKNYYLERTISGYMPCVMPIVSKQDVMLWVWKQKKLNKWTN